jgi:acetylornithine deacetylase/succinyl-diaminopimelate desuccinylase-like protein
MTSEKSTEYGRLEPMLAALEALVRCESPSEDLDACAEVVRLASDIATRVLGVPAQIKTIEGRPVFWWGSEKPEVLVLAHLDTVWPHGSFQPVWDIQGDVLRGPGTFDMKAGFIQALYALKGIEGPVALVATTDEETGSHASKALIKELSASAKAVLVLEASLDGKVKTGRKGTAMYQIKVIGLASHAGLDPEKGVNATTEIAHAILALGADRAVVGTSAATDPERIAEILGAAGDRIVVGADMIDGYVATHGWQVSSGERVEDFGIRMVGLGAQRFLFTDVSRDGMLQGCNVDATAAFALAVGKPVIASGGVRDMDDIRALVARYKDGIESVVMGKSLYSGTLDLGEALTYAREQS